MSQTAIEFNNVGKLYHLGVVGTGTLSHDLNRWWRTKILGQPDPYLKIGETNDRTVKGTSQFVWALKDIDLKINQGDVVGIIGRNGAGKSTLLKLLSRVTTPTVGTIKAKGRIASLLEVGTGFHPELTGRENVYMNGSIMGMTKHEITQKLEEIVDFAGVARYIDTPVKRYSSGMIVRLGFAVAAFLEPEILVVDEVLAVGDADFQKKAIGKMQDVASGSGRTVLFVSHNMAAVRNLCKSGVLLENGTVKYTGTASEAIREYLSSGKADAVNQKITERVQYCKGTIHITDIQINGQPYCSTTVLSNQEILTIRVEGDSDDDFTTDLMAVFVTKDQMPLATLAEGHYKGKLIKFKSGHFVIEKTIKLPRFISHGTCFVNLFMHHPMLEWQLRAPNCCTVEFEGGQMDIGAHLNLEDGGFLGLDTI